MHLRKDLTWYIIISFGIAWILFLLPIPFGSPDSTTRRTIATICMTAAMWAPGLAALLVTRFVDQQPLSNLNLKHLGEKRAYLWAWLLPIIFAVITGLLTWAFGLGKLDLEFSQIKQAMAQMAGEPVWSPVLVVLVQAVTALTIGSLFNTIFAVGEELGWRGYLFPKLLPMGQWKAILLTGIIWGIWHAPVILQGHNYPGHPILGVFLMIGFCLLLGAILCWLYLRTGSPWAPALAHGAINASAGLPLMFLTGVEMTLGGTIASLTGWIPMILFVGWLVWSKQLPESVNSIHSPPNLTDSSHAR
jgi:membrane protease YdiL (CAAX protease family)